MPLYKFGPKDVLRNRIKTYSDNTFFVNSASIYYNNRNDITGEFVENVTHVPTGYVSLYELNVDRDFSAHTYDPDANTGKKTKIFPFITKDSSLNCFSTISTNNFNQFQYGDIITGSYPLSASITRETFESSTSPTGSHLLALRNTLNYYKTVSPHYAFSSSLGDKAQQEVTLISIPSIFYGSSIRKNSVRLDFYISGTLVASCEDVHRNGELIQTSGTTYAQANGSDKVAGVVLYREGFVLLTGSWDLTEDTYDFGPGSARQGNWKDFAAGANDGLSPGDLTLSASFSLNFQSTNYINTVTMNCDAPKGDLNYSSNPTFLSAAMGQASTSVNGYFQNNQVSVKNTVSSSFYNYEEDYKPQTFITKIGVYDKNRNLIAVANLAKPIRKTDDRDYTFRLKLDI